MPSASVIRAEVSAQGVKRIQFDATALTTWDSSLITFLLAVADLCRSRRIELDLSGLPSGLRRLVTLAQAVSEKEGSRSQPFRSGFLAGVGNATIHFVGRSAEVASFVGATAIAFLHTLDGRARYRKVDLIAAIRACGADALPIVTLISFLVGVIVAFMGAVQLQKFGAALYVADLVGIGVVREMGAMMTGIIMAGRTGAAFAAQIGTMKVTQEIDALTTTGVSPLEFLVIPRIIALVVMMPLLCIHADAVGILGGAAVGTSMLGLPVNMYLRQTIMAVNLKDLFGGLFKSAVYGFLIAMAGCLRGLQCGSSASAVGDATTSAVVTGIISIVAACGLFAVIFYVLGI